MAQMAGWPPPFTCRGNKAQRSPSQSGDTKSSHASNGHQGVAMVKGDQQSSQGWKNCQHLSSFNTNAGRCMGPTRSCSAPTAQGRKACDSPKGFVVASVQEDSEACFLFVNLGDRLRNKTWCLITTPNI